MHIRWRVVIKSIIFSLLLGLFFPSRVTAREISNTRIDGIPVKMNYISQVRELSESEMEYFILLIYVEAGIEEEEGQLATAATILNRVESTEFPNSIKEVAFQKGAFSSTRNDKFYIGEQEITIDEVPNNIRVIAERALAGEDPTEDALESITKALGLDTEKYASSGALYFYNPKICSEKALKDRENIKVSVKLGRHIYYKYWDN